VTNVGKCPLRMLLPSSERLTRRVRVKDMAAGAEWAGRFDGGIDERASRSGVNSRKGRSRLELTAAAERDLIRART